MPQEALDERVGLKLYDLHAIALLPVAKGEANSVSLYVEQTVVGNGHAMGIPSEVLENGFRSTERKLGVYDPLFPV